MHAPRPFNLPVCSLERETPQTLNTARLARAVIWAKINSAIFQCRRWSPRAARRPSSEILPLFSPLPPSSARSFTLSLLTPSPRPLSPFCLIASAPPYNHAGSRLSFGVVYIAVIVRAQCGDWAEHVYSFTGQRRHKSARGEEKVFSSESEGWRCWCAQALARARSHFHWRAAALKQHGETERKKKASFESHCFHLPASPLCFCM